MQTSDELMEAEKVMATVSRLPSRQLAGRVLPGCSCTNGCEDDPDIVLADAIYSVADRLREVNATLGRLLELGERATKPSTLIRTAFRGGKPM